MTTYSDAANQGYQRLLGLYGQINFVRPGSQPNGFWLCANISHTIIAYLVATRSQDTNNFVENSLLGNFEFKVPYDSSPAYLQGLTTAGLESNDYWLDDYGWWGNALLYTLDYKDVLGLSPQLADRLLTGAKNCWIIMNGGWDRNNTPPIPGGVWNCDRLDIDVSGRNCVTNEVYWLMSLHLYRATQDKTYLDPSSADWFVQAKDQNLLFIGTAGKEYLIGERFKGERNWHEGWYWAGDQGLFR
jgi:hypothetical protein